jgi:hypothetical protein
MPRGDTDRLLDSIFSIGSALTSRTSIGPPGAASSKTPIASRPVYHASRIKVGPVLFEDRPICMLMVPVYDVALAVAAVVIVWIDFPYNVFGVLLIQRTNRRGREVVQKWWGSGRTAMPAVRSFGAYWDLHRLTIAKPRRVQQ